jgi:hypothetical protein
VPNYPKLAEVAKKLIEKSGRTVTLRRLSETPADPTKPWRNTNSTVVEMSMIAVMLDGQYVDGADDLVRRGMREAVVAAKSARSARSKLLHAEVGVGGAGYSVADIVTLAGGTSTTSATITVQTVDGLGAVLTFSVTDPGVFVTLSSALTAASVAPPGGTGLVLKNAVFAATDLTQFELRSLVLDAAGASYSVDDIITLAGGAAITPATVKVLSVGGGGSIGIFSILDPGLYLTTAPNLTQAGVAPPGGSGATFKSATFSVLDLTQFDELVDGTETWKIDQIIRVAPGSEDLVWRFRLRK